MAKFCYFNINPNKTKRNDCVTRAITFATDMPYAKIRKKLFHTARLLDCEKLCWSCYNFLIQEVLGGIPKNCDGGMTVGEFADLHHKGTYLIRIDGHLTVVKNNTIYDIWDCRNRKCFLAWEIH